MSRRTPRPPEESNMTQQVFTDRSRIITAQRCRRQRFHEYHDGEAGVGIVSARKPLPLAVGGAVHAGLAVLLAGGQRVWNAEAAFHLAIPQWAMLEEDAVNVALMDFTEYAGKLDVDATERATFDALASGTPVEASAEAESLADPAFVEYARRKSARAADAKSAFDAYLYAEQSALVEALVRAYARRRLRPLLEEFEVLEVEREGTWLLSEWISNVRTRELDIAVCSNDLLPDVELYFMSRPDALLLSRADRQLYLLSYKTTSGWDVRKARDAEHDMQGLSEGVEVEKRLGEWWYRIHGRQEGPDPAPFMAPSPTEMSLRVSAFLRSDSCVSLPPRRASSLSATNTSSRVTAGRIRGCPPGWASRPAHRSRISYTVTTAPRPLTRPARGTGHGTILSRTARASSPSSTTASGYRLPSGSPCRSANGLTSSTPPR